MTYADSVFFFGKKIDITHGPPEVDEISSKRFKEEETDMFISLISTPTVLL